PGRPAARAAASAAAQPAGASAGNASPARCPGAALAAGLAGASDLGAACRQVAALQRTCRRLSARRSVPPARGGGSAPREIRQAGLQPPGAVLGAPAPGLPIDHAALDLGV